MPGPEDYDFDLPAAQIAQTPAARRGDARMLVLAEPGRPRQPGCAPWHHREARELPACLPRDALVVVNDSRVVPARLHLDGPDRRFELLVCDPRPGLGPGAGFTAWVRGARRLRPGQLLTDGPFTCRYLGADEGDPRARRFEVVAGELLPTLARAGQIPLPPYIRRPADAADAERYQTLYARHPGSVAAPTAGLHWEQAVLEALDLVSITLHVGPGTFLPMEAADVRDHRVAAEHAEISAAAAGRILTARRAGRPIVAIGTTATRALEAVAARGELAAYRGPVDLVITPDHEFRVVDWLVTNFHLPRSSLLMLVCSFGGQARVLAAYAEAVRAGYRFYSYGDCMILPRA